MIKLASKLTLKQEKYIQELVKGKTQREAYKAAYNTKKMSDKTIDEKASRLLSQGKVRARYNELKQRLIKEMEDNCIIEAKDIIQELIDIAFDDIGDYVSFRTEKQVVAYDDDGDPIFDYKTIIELKDSKDIDTKNISEISLSANGIFKFKMYDRQAALYKLAEIFGLNKIQEDKQRLAEARFKHDVSIDSKRYW